jgi:hypothetical protein
LGIFFEKTITQLYLIYKAHRRVSLNIAYVNMGKT